MAKHHTLAPTDILVVGTQGYLLAFAKKTGELLWKHEFAISFWSTNSAYSFVNTFVAGDKVFANCFSKIYGFELTTGKVLWEDDLQGQGYGMASFAVAPSEATRFVPDLLIVGTQGYLLTIAQATGEPVWEYKFPKPLWLSAGFVNLLVDGKLLFAHCHGNVFCFDLYQGRPLWHDELKGVGFGTATLATAETTSNSLVAINHYLESKPSGT